MLGESGLLKQLTNRLVERALAGELGHHLTASGVERTAAPEPAPHNSRNGHSPKRERSDFCVNLDFSTKE